MNNISDTSKSLIFDSEEEVQRYSENKNLILMIYNNIVIDVTSFTEYHPGGGEILEDYNCYDITDIMTDQRIHRHSQFALKKLMSFKIGEILSIEQQLEYQKNTERLNRFQIDENSHFIKQNLNINVTETDIIIGDLIIKRNKGAAWQLSKLPLEKYLKITSETVPVKYLRIFDNCFLEYISRIHSTILFVFWLTISCLFIYYGTSSNLSSELKLTSKINLHSKQFSFGILALVVLFGVVFWTKIEYLLERFLFHLDSKLPDFRIAKILHFVLHQSHHFAPDDKGLIYMNPFFICCTILILFTLTKWISDFTISCIFNGGVIFGYLISDFIHYQLHKGRSKIPYIRELKEKHQKHHYEKYNYYGIGTYIWDYIYRTTTSN